MGILRNPHEVGIGNAPPVKRTGRCPCCGWPVEWEGSSADPSLVRMCADCPEHAEEAGEPPERTLDRYRAHAYVAQKLAAGAANGARDAEAKAKLAEEKARDAGRRTGAALESHDAYQALALAAAGEHIESPDGRRCSCGSTCPCPTVAAMRAADPGRYRGLLDEIVRRAGGG